MSRSEYKIGDAFHLLATRAAGSPDGETPHYSRKETLIVRGLVSPGISPDFWAFAQCNHRLLDWLRVLATSQCTLDGEATARMISMGEKIDSAVQQAGNDLAQAWFVQRCRM